MRRRRFSFFVPMLMLYPGVLAPVSADAAVFTIYNGTRANHLATLAYSRTEKIDFIGQVSPAGEIEFSGLDYQNASRQVRIELDAQGRFASLQSANLQGGEQFTISVVEWKTEQTAVLELKALGDDLQGVTVRKRINFRTSASYRGDATDAASALAALPPTASRLKLRVQTCESWPSNISNRQIIASVDYKGDNPTPLYFKMVRTAARLLVGEEHFDPLALKETQIDRVKLKRSSAKLFQWGCELGGRFLPDVCVGGGPFWGPICAAAIEQVKTVFCEGLPVAIDWVKEALTRHEKRRIKGDFTLTAEVSYKDPYGGTRTARFRPIVHTGATGGKYDRLVELPCWGVATGPFGGPGTVKARIERCPCSPPQSSSASGHVSRLIYPVTAAGEPVVLEGEITADSRTLICVFTDQDGKKHNVPWKFGGTRPLMYDELNVDAGSATVRFSGRFTAPGVLATANATLQKSELALSGTTNSYEREIEGTSCGRAVSESTFSLQTDLSLVTGP